MAGNKRIAAIIFFCLTAFGATGGGAYYLLVHSGWTLALKHDDTAGHAQSQAATPAELDAVANAWATPSAEQTISDDTYGAVDSSIPARTEVVLPARAEEPAISQPVVEDRYALASIPATAIPATPAVSGEAQELYTVPDIATPDVTSDSTQQLPADNAARYDEQLPDAASEESAAPSYESASVARGQEPNDEAAGVEVSDVAIEPALAARELSHVTDDAGSQTSLALPANEPEQSTAAQRARNAFRASQSPYPTNATGPLPLRLERRAPLRTVAMRWRIRLNPKTSAQLCQPTTMN